MIRWPEFIFIGNKASAQSVRIHDCGFKLGGDGDDDVDYVGCEGGGVVAVVVLVVVLVEVIVGL